jgi:hypothetical protein
MIRMNHKGKSMDAEVPDIPEPGNVPEVVSHVKEVRKEGMGVISMKLAGEGTFNREDRQKAMKFAFTNAGVDCVTVGYKNSSEIDEAIESEPGVGIDHPLPRPREGTRSKIFVPTGAYQLFSPGGGASGARFRSSFDACIRSTIIPNR